MLSYTDNAGGYYPGETGVANASIDGNQDYLAINYSSNYLYINVPSNAYNWGNYLNISDNISKKTETRTIIVAH